MGCLTVARRIRRGSWVTVWRSEAFAGVGEVDAELWMSLRCLLG